MIKTWYQRRDETLRTGSGEIRFSVEPGIYYIQLKRRSGDGNYQLTQSFDEEKTTELQPNDTLEQAQPLALGDTAYGVIGIGYARNSGVRRVPAGNPRGKEHHLYAELSAVRRVPPSL